jgi:hypothetical protein
MNSVAAGLDPKLLTTTLKAAKSYMGSGTPLTQLYLLGFTAVILIVFLLTAYIYIKFFHSVTFRFFQLSKMINLEPHNRDFCQAIGKCIQKYNSTFLEENIISYDSNIQSNLYFYKDFIDYNKAYSEINSFLNEVGIAFNAKQSYPDEQYQLDIATVVNSRFSWSVSDKLINKPEYKHLKKDDIEEKFFKHLHTITEYKKENQNIIESFVENVDNNILSFIDTSSLTLETFKNNKLIKTYGTHLDKSIISYFADISQNIQQTNDKESGENEENDEGNGNDKQPKRKFNIQSLSNVLYDEDNLEQFEKHGVPIPISMYLEDIIERITTTLYTYYGISPDDINRSEENEEDKDKSKCAKQEPQIQKKIDELNEEEFKEYEVRMSFIQMLSSMNEQYIDQFENNNNEKDFNLFIDKYFLLEKFIYTCYDSSGLNMFNELEINIIIANYQTIMDLMYIHSKKELIELSIIFTLYFLMDENENKMDNLELLSEFYVSHFELYMINNEYRPRLDRYNESRKPDVSKLNKMYREKLEHIKQYYFIQPWLEFDILWGDFKRPPKYRWVLDWLRKYLDIRKVPQMITSVFKEGFEQHEHFTEKDNTEKHTYKFDEYHQENFVSSLVRGLKSVFAAPFKPFLGPIKAFGDFIMTLIKIVSILVNPLKLLQLIGKLILVLFLIIPMLIYSAIPISSDLYGPGEILLYSVVLLIGALVHLVVGVFGPALFTWLGWQIDVKLPVKIGGLSPGWLYIFVYRFFGACENEPTAWYEYAGYHYGNKNERKFWAYSRCRESFGPDKKFSNLMCGRKLFQEPKYCPRANIYRLRSNRNLNARTPIQPGTFYPDLDFINGSNVLRNTIIKNFKQMKHNFYKNCESSMNRFDNITKTICKNFDKLEEIKDKKMLKNLCYNSYCTNGKRDMFCYKLTGDSSIKQQMGEKSKTYRLIFVFVYISIATLMINSMVSTQGINPPVSNPST